MQVFQLGQQRYLYKKHGVLGDAQVGGEVKMSVVYALATPLLSRQYVSLEYLVVVAYYKSEIFGLDRRKIRRFYLRTIEKQW